MIPISIDDEKGGMYMFSVFEDLFREANALNGLIGRDKGTEPLLVRFVTFAEAHGGGYDEIHENLSKIEDRLSEWEFPELRRMFLEDLLQALKMQCREGMGEDISFADRVRTYVGVPGEPISDEEMQRWKEEAGERLRVAGYDGSTDSMLSQWKKDRAIPRDDFPRVAGDLINKALRETRQKVVDLPESAACEFEPVRDVFYGGYSKATGPFTSTVTLNADLRWSWPQLQNTVAHESFPGHSALNALRAQQAMAGVLPPEACFYFANTPITPIIEGTCNLGVRFLGWDEHPDFAIVFAAGMYEQGRTNRWLFAYHQDGRSKAEILRQMVAEGGMTQVEAETRFRFLSDPLWCTSMPHYYHGTQVTTEAWKKYEGQGRIDELAKIVFEEIHTFRTFKSRTGLR